METIFEGIVSSHGHDVTTTSGGTHRCDANTTSGTTATSALDDASRLHNSFTWDAYVIIFSNFHVYLLYMFKSTFFYNFEDFLVTRIGNSTQTCCHSWRLLINFEDHEMGGCHQQVQETDHVLWDFDGFCKTHFLNITGPLNGQVNHPITVSVTDGWSGKAISGASVAGNLTDSQGQVNLTFTKAGSQRLKAEKWDSIRSNALEITIKP